MNKKLAKSAQSVQDALKKAGLTATVLEMPSSTRTAVDAANSIGCSVEQIVKSLIFKTQGTSAPILVLASGSNRVDEKIIESFVGHKIERADANFIRAVTGFAIGGIPPIGHKEKIEFIFIDQDLLKFSSVWAAAGTPNAVFELESKDLVSLTAGKIISTNNSTC